MIIAVNDPARANKVADRPFTARHTAPMSMSIIFRRTKAGLSIFRREQANTGPKKQRLIGHWSLRWSPAGPRPADIDTDAWEEICQKAAEQPVAMDLDGVENDQGDLPAVDDRTAAPAPHQPPPAPLTPEAVLGDLNKLLHVAYAGDLPPRTMRDLSNSLKRGAALLDSLLPAVWNNGPTDLVALDDNTRDLENEGMLDIGAMAQTAT